VGALRGTLRWYHTAVIGLERLLELRETPQFGFSMRAKVPQVGR